MCRPGAVAGGATAPDGAAGAPKASAGFAAGASGCAARGAVAGALPDGAPSAGCLIAPCPSRACLPFSGGTVARVFDVASSLPAGAGGVTVATCSPVPINGTAQLPSQICAAPTPTAKPRTARAMVAAGALFFGGAHDPPGRGSSKASVGPDGSWAPIAGADGGGDACSCSGASLPASSPLRCAFRSASRIVLTKRSSLRAARSGRPRDPGAHTGVWRCTR